MKKLTKKSLDELAEIMPVINEKNQQECVGGSAYVYGTGDLILNTQQTPYAGDYPDHIYVTNDSGLFYYQHNKNNPYCESVLRNNYSTGIEFINQDQRAQIYISLSSGIYSADGLEGYAFADNANQAAIYIENNQVIFNTHNSGDLMRLSVVQNAWAALSGYQPTSGIEP